MPERPLPDWSGLSFAFSETDVIYLAHGDLERKLGGGDSELNASSHYFQALAFFLVDVLFGLEADDFAAELGRQAAWVELLNTVNAAPAARERVPVRGRTEAHRAGNTNAGQHATARSTHLVTFALRAWFTMCFSSPVKTKL